MSQKTVKRRVVASFARASASTRASTSSGSLDGSTKPESSVKHNRNGTEIIEESQSRAPNLEKSQSFSSVNSVSSSTTNKYKREKANIGAVTEVANADVFTSDGEDRPDDEELEHKGSVVPVLGQRTVLFYGDSLTWGMAHSYTGRYEVSWPRILEERLSRYGFIVVEAALCSRTTKWDDPNNIDWMKGAEPHYFNGIRHFGPEFLNAAPSWLILLLGTNDLKTCNRQQAKKRTRMDASEVAKNLADIALKARKMHRSNPFCVGELKIVIVCPPAVRLTPLASDLGYDMTSVVISNDFKRAYQEVCEQHGFLFAHAEIDMTKSVDGIHITEEANKRVAEAVWKVMRNELGEELLPPVSAKGETNGIEKKKNGRGRPPKLHIEDGNLIAKRRRGRPRKNRSDQTIANEEKRASPHEQEEVLQKRKRESTRRKISAKYATSMDGDEESPQEFTYEMTSRREPHRKHSRERTTLRKVGRPRKNIAADDAKVSSGSDPDIDSEGESNFSDSDEDSSSAQRGRGEGDWESSQEDGPRRRGRKPSLNNETWIVQRKAAELSMVKFLKTIQMAIPSLFLTFVDLVNRLQGITRENEKVLHREIFKLIKAHCDDEDIIENLETIFDENKTFYIDFDAYWEDVHHARKRRRQELAEMKKSPTAPMNRTAGPSMPEVPTNGKKPVQFASQEDFLKVLSEAADGAEDLASSSSSGSGTESSNDDDDSSSGSEFGSDSDSSSVSHSDSNNSSSSDSSKGK